MPALLTEPPNTARLVRACQGCGSITTTWRRAGLCWACYTYTETAPKCAHCGEDTTRWRRRGLCWRCYGVEPVRHSTPRRHADELDLAAGVDLRGSGAPVPGELILPVTRAERLRALAFRADRRETLFSRSERLPIERVAEAFGVEVPT